jgi:3-phosphoshikimate 1-carboxyvinyltransferase
MSISLERISDVDIHISAPPSKSYTHRALLAAALAGGESYILSPLAAGDTLITQHALKKLGVSIEEQGADLRVEGCGGRLPCRGPVTLDCGNSGTTLRLLAGASLLCAHPVTITGDARMQERPLGPLADTLRTLGADVRFLGKPGFPPVRIAGELTGGRAEIDASMSSQFVSSVLMAAPYSQQGVDLRVHGAASRSYLDITLDVMAAFGVRADREDYRRFRVIAGGYTGRRYRIEGDYSSASYWFAIGAACGGRVAVGNLNPDSCQGDLRFLSVLEEMGCSIAWTDPAVILTRTGALSGVDVDMSSMPDAVPTLCAVAAFAKSPTRISGIGHLQYKESNRTTVIVQMLRDAGVEAHAGPDSITVIPDGIGGGTIDPCNDHRIAMAGAVLGLGAGGVRIGSPACVDKSYPGFWEILKELGLWNG